MTGQPRGLRVPDAGGELERKLLLPDEAAPAALRLLERRCRADPAFPVGIVSSIYYDTPDLALLDEKLDSDFVKTKVRLRWYSDLDTGRPGPEAWLELKRRLGPTRTKLRKRTGRSGAWAAEEPLDSPELLHLLGLLGRADGLPRRLRPVLEVRYARHRFVDPESGSRVCLDHEIRVPRTARARLGTAASGALRVAVVELKFPGHAQPALLRTLGALGCRPSSFSKYAAACARAGRSRD